MHRFFFSLGLLGAKAYSQQPIQIDGRVCYEYVEVITYVDARPTPTATTPSVSTMTDPEVTIERPYTGTSPITGPITSTAPAEGTELGTVVIETPATDTNEAQYITVYTPDTGTPPLTTASTTTIPPSGTVPGTVIITVPTSTPDEPPVEPTDIPVESMSSPSVEFTFPPPTTAPEQAPAPEPATEEEESTQEPTSTINEPPGETFDCDAGGYLIQQNTLYRLNLATGENPIVRRNVGQGGNINALGYNIKDNFLYAFISIGDSQQELVRIDAAGDTVLLPLKVPSGLNVADIDNNGQFWVSSRGNRWIQVDLDPSSATFAQQIDEGRSSGTAIADWVFLENGGRYLYSIELGAGSVAVRWSMDTHVYEELRDYGDVVPGGSGFGALYAVGDEIWGSDNQSGDIIAFPILSDSGPARKITDGPITSSNDGARCFQAPPPEAAN